MTLVSCLLECDDRPHLSIFPPSLHVLDNGLLLLLLLLVAAASQVVPHRHLQDTELRAQAMNLFLRPVPDFTIIVYGSSCNSQFIYLIITSLLSPYTVFNGIPKS